VFSFGCQLGPGTRPNAVLPRVAPNELVVRTESFAFHMGVGIDPTWPEKAEETRIALGARLPELLDEEDTTVPILARQLGVTWPGEVLDFDVILAGEDSRPCDAKIARLLLAGGGAGRDFFACVLERSFARLGDQSELHRALTAANAREADGLYACIVAYAVAAVMVARAEGRAEAHAAEARIAGSCSPGAEGWIGREWIKRVRSQETAAAFGERAAAALLTERPRPDTPSTP
jgi:hypothetical protein